MAYSGIHQLIYSRHREKILGASLVQVCEFYTYPPLPILLFHHHSVGQPFKVEHLLDSPRLLKYHHLVFDRIGMILG